MGTLARHLTRLGIERRRARMAVDPLQVDVRSGAPMLGERVAARELDGTRCHPGHPRCRRRAGGADRGSRRRREEDVLRLELRARRLEDHVRDALPHFGGSAVHLGRELAVLAVMEPHARSRVVVEALRVADVLEPDGEADTALHTLAARRVARAAGKANGVARQLLRLGNR